VGTLEPCRLELSGEPAAACGADLLELLLVVLLQLGVDVGRLLVAVVVALAVLRCPGAVILVAGCHRAHLCEHVLLLFLQLGNLVGTQWNQPPSKALLGSIPLAAATAPCGLLRPNTTTGVGLRRGPGRSAVNLSVAL
jgi:hypothetical protein